MAEAMENIFSRRVKDLMKENRFSQKKLCELCSITEAAFSELAHIMLRHTQQSNIGEYDYLDTS